MARHIENLRAIFQKGVNSVQPAALFNQNKINRINAHMITINDYKIDLTNKNSYLVGFGKAVLGMAVQMECVLDKNLKSGIISIPVDITNKFKNNLQMRLKENSVIKIYEGAKNNLPDDKSLNAAKEIYSLANKMSKDDILFVLISGGGSALLPLPLELLDLNSKLDIIKKLSNAGATIEELNTVRIEISQIKGGKLSLAAKNSSQIISLIISDIINNPIHLIASGPTVEYKRNENNLNAKLILEKFNIWNSLTDDLKLIFENSLKISKNIDQSVAFPKQNHVFIIGNNEIAVKACQDEGKILSYSSFILSTSIKGNVEELCNQYIKFLKQLLLFKQKSISRNEFIQDYPFESNNLENLCQVIESESHISTPILLILAGEPSVKVIGKGLGGRNQELALRLSLECYKDQLLNGIYILCAGTDGIDGPTTAAGAIGCSDTIKDYINDNNKTIEEIEYKYIKNNDSFNFYKTLQNGKYHINIGHTGTNVMDLHLIILE